MTELEYNTDVEYELERFQIGPFSIELTTISYMPIEQLLKNQSNGVEISGQKLWCGSLVVIEYLLTHRNFVESNLVIELGGGTGLLGMICSLLNADYVYLTDHDDKSLRHMKIDVVTNNLSNCEVVYLNWCNEITAKLKVIQNIKNSSHIGSSCSSSYPKLRIVAGDVLYKASLLIPFFDTIKSIIDVFSKNNDNSTNGCEIEMLLCHVPRAGNEHEHVLAVLNDYSFNDIMEISSEEWKKGVCTDLAPDEDYNNAKLYLIKFSTVNYD